MRTALKNIKNLLVEKSKTTDLTIEDEAILDEISKYDGYFPITSIHRDDLKQSGFETRNVDDATMERLASKLSDDYCNQLYWESLDIIADMEGVQRMTEPKFEFIKKGVTVLYDEKEAIVLDAPEYSIDDDSEITLLQNEKEIYVEAIELIQINAN